MSRFLIILITVFLSVCYCTAAQADVFHLKDGSLKVGKRISPADSACVKVETLKGRVEFTSDEVESVEPWKGILRQYKKLRAQLDLKRVHNLITLARWCRQKGLFEEMFQLYDQLMEKASDHPDLKAFVYEMTMAIDYDGMSALSLEDEKDGFKLLKKISSDGPTKKRIGQELLLSLTDEILMEVLLKGLKSPKEKVKLESVKIMGLASSPQTIKPLIATALFERKEPVRAASLGVLMDMEHEGIIYPFLRALRLNQKSYRMNALDALAAFKDLRAAGALISNLAPSSGSPGSHRGHIYVGNITSSVTGFDTEIATSAAIASPVISLLQDGILLDVNVLGVSQRSIGKSERKRTAEVLKSISGMDYGTDFVLWNEWWRNNYNKIKSR